MLGAQVLQRSEHVLGLDTHNSAPKTWLLIGYGNVLALGGRHLLHPHKRHTLLHPNSTHCAANVVLQRGLHEPLGVRGSKNVQPSRTVAGVFCTSCPKPLLPCCRVPGDICHFGTLSYIVCNAHLSIGEAVDELIAPSVHGSSQKIIKKYKFVYSYLKMTSHLF